MIVAIDPGINGAAAALSLQSGFRAVIDLPTIGEGKRREIHMRKLYDWLCTYAPTRIVIEHVHSMPKQGLSSTFRFGMAYGMIRAVSQMFTRNVELVTAQVWEEYFDLIGKHEYAALHMARQLFSEHAELLERQKDHNRADAMLIGWWAIRPPVGRNW